MAGKGLWWRSGAGLRSVPGTQAEDDAPAHRWLLGSTPSVLAPLSANTLTSAIAKGDAAGEVSSLAQQGLLHGWGSQPGGGAEGWGTSSSIWTGTSGLAEWTSGGAAEVLSTTATSEQAIPLRPVAAAAPSGTLHRELPPWLVGAEEPASAGALAPAATWTVSGILAEGESGLALDQATHPGASPLQSSSTPSSVASLAALPAADAQPSAAPSADSLALAPIDETVSATSGQAHLNQLPNYNLSLALDAVLLSQVAYEDDLPLLRLGTWTPLKPAAGVVSGLNSVGGYRADNGFELPLGSIDSAYAFAATRMAGSTKEFVIAFAGTDFGSIGDVQSDFQTYGFSHYYKQMQPLFAEVLLQALAAKDDDQDVRILITGHSLGGAVAQAAFADLVINPQLGMWSSPSAPLGVGQRLYDISQIKSKASDIAALAAQTQVITFGAPSLLIDPYKLTVSDITNVIGSSISSGGTAGFVRLLEILAIKAVQWAVPGINLNLDEVGLINFAAKLHQYELENSGIERGGDPVSSLGPRDLGAVFDIDIRQSRVDLPGFGTLQDRYEALTPFIGLAMHASASYRESIIRAFTNTGLTQYCYFKGSFRSDWMLTTVARQPVAPLCEG